MLLNNLDPEVAERPEELVVYGGSGKAARNHDALRAIVRSLLTLGEARHQGAHPGVVRHDHDFVGAAGAGGLEELVGRGEVELRLLGDVDVEGVREHRRRLACAHGRAREQNRRTYAGALQRASHGGGVAASAVVEGAVVIVEPDVAPVGFRVSREQELDHRRSANPARSSRTRRPSIASIARHATSTTPDSIHATRRGRTSTSGSRTVTSRAASAASSTITTIQAIGSAISRSRRMSGARSWTRTFRS